MLHLGFNDYDDFERELNSDDTTKYIFEMTTPSGFPQKNLPIKNQAQAEAFTEKYAESFSKDPDLIKLYNYLLRKRYGDDVEFIEINQFYFKHRCYVAFNFKVNTPLTCRELDERFGEDGIWAAYWPVEVLEIVQDKDIDNQIIGASSEIEDNREWLSDIEPYGYINRADSFDKFTAEDWAYYLASNWDWMDEQDYYDLLDDINNLMGAEWARDYEDDLRKLGCFEDFARFTNAYQIL